MKNKRRQCLKLLMSICLFSVSLLSALVGTNVQKTHVYAAQDHTHGTQGNEDYIVFDQAFSCGTLTTGNYVLTSDVTLTGDVFVVEDSNVKICLNGHTIKFDGAYSFKTVYHTYNEDKIPSLTIMDCNSTNRGKLVSTSNQTEHLFKLNKSNVKFENIEIESTYNDISFVFVENGQTAGNLSFNNCHVKVGQYLVKIEGYRWNINFTGKSNKNTGEYDIESLSSYYSDHWPLFYIKKGTVDFKNVGVYNEIHSCILQTNNSTVNIDENCVFEMNCLYTGIHCTGSDLKFKGNIFYNSNHVATTEEKNQKIDKKSLIVISDGAQLHIYNSTIINSLDNYYSLLFLYDDETDTSECIVEEALSTNQKFNIFCGNNATGNGDYILEARDVILGFNEHNADKDFKDFFKFAYTSSDKVPFFLDINKEDDVISFVAVNFTTQPTSEDKTVKANKDDVTYQWHKAEAKYGVKLEEEDYAEIPEGYSIDEKGYFTYDTEKEFAPSYVNDITQYNQFGLYLAEGTYVYDDEAGTNSVSISLTAMANWTKDYKFKLYIIIGDQEIELSDEYSDDFDAMYEDGYIKPYASPTGTNLNIYSFHISYLINDPSSPFYSLSQNPNYKVKLVVEEDIPWYVFTKEYLDQFTLYSLQLFEGAKFYLGYDSINIKEAIEGETSATLKTNAAGQYACVVTRDNLSISSDILTIEVDGINTTNPIDNTGSNNHLSFGAILLIIILILVLLYIVQFILWKIEYDKKQDDRKLEFLDIVNKPINNLLFNRE